MTRERSSAVIVGIFFISATLFYVVGQIVHGPIVGSLDYLRGIYPNRMTVVGGIFIELLGILSIPMIAVYMLPILRKHSHGLAVGYVIFRSLEALLLIGVSICTLSLIHIRQANPGTSGTTKSSGSRDPATSSWKETPPI